MCIVPRKLPETYVVRTAGFVELGAWQRRDLRQSADIQFFPWSDVSDLPIVPPSRRRRRKSEISQHEQGIATARRYQALLDEGTVHTRAELARYLGVSRARVTQVLGRLKTG